MTNSDGTPPPRESDSGESDLSFHKAYVRGVPPQGADEHLAPPPDPVRLLMVEDSQIVRERIRRLVAEFTFILVVGVAEDGFQGRALFRRYRPDAVLLDIELPGIGGLDLLVEFKREHPECMVIVLTNYTFKGIRERCLALGANHFFDKSKDFERIPEVLRTLQN